MDGSQPEAAASNSNSSSKKKAAAVTSVPAEADLVLTPTTTSGNVFLMEAGTADLDLSTDAGTIGRASGKRGAGRTLSLDLKGLVYDAHVVTGPSLLVVNVVGTEARIETVVDQYLQTALTASHLNHERVLEGSLDDYRIDDSVPGDRPKAEAAGSSKGSGKGSGRGAGKPKGNSGGAAGGMAAFQPKVKTGRASKKSSKGKASKPARKPTATPAKAGKKSA